MDGCELDEAERLSLAVLREASRSASPAVRFTLMEAIAEDLACEEQRLGHGLMSGTHHRQQLIGALRSVAEAIGHPPSRRSYRRERERRAALGDGSLPPLSAQLRFFRRWPDALAAAFAPTSTPQDDRILEPPTKIRMYGSDRLEECLRACAEWAGRPPTTRLYEEWRRAILEQREDPTLDIPVYSTFRLRYGSWSQALEAAGLDGSSAARYERAALSEIS